MFFYREQSPSIDLQHLVLSFWEFTVRLAHLEPVDHEIFPDGCISLIYRRNANQGWSGFATNSLHRRSIVVPVFDGDIFWGVRLSPAAAATILKRDPARVEKHLWKEEAGVLAQYGMFDRALLAALDQCTDFDKAVEILSHRVRSLGVERAMIDAAVSGAVKFIEEHGGEVRIGEMAHSFELSLRQFERRFKQSAGLTPKQYARARRLRTAAAVIALNDSVSWAERAAEMGFADQSHLSHEISSITGRSPGSLARKVKKIKHGTLVK
jgi:AraC-like DNA-binding protein